MNSEEFIQACEDGKTLVWGHKGLKIIKKNDSTKKISCIDFESGVAIVFDRVEKCGDMNVFMAIGEKLVGIIPTEDWELLIKEAKE